MGNPQSNQFKTAADTAGAVSRQAYGVGIPALTGQLQQIQAAIASGGEPDYMKNAYDLQRAGVLQGGASQERLAQGQADMANRGAVAGGNLSSVINPKSFGAQLADQLYSSRMNEGMGRLDEMNKLFGMGIGRGAEAGSASNQAAAHQLQAIGMTPAYNPTYAAILGAGNLGAGIYGAYQNQTPSSFQGNWTTPQGTLTSFRAD